MIALAGILAAILLGAISPGPSFVVVARTAVASSRTHALATALGIGMGGFTFALLAVLGLRTALSDVPWVYLALKTAGGAYLAYVAISLWRDAAKPVAIGPKLRETEAGDVVRAVGRGLTTQISNPKTAVVYGSVFAALLPANPPLWLEAPLPPLIFTVETAWYGAVALTLATPGPRHGYLRAKTIADRVAATAIGALGFRMSLTGLRRLV